MSEFVVAAFAELGIELAFWGKGLDEVGVADLMDAQKYDCIQASGLPVTDRRCS